MGWFSSTPKKKTTLATRVRRAEAKATKKAEKAKLLTRLNKANEFLKK